MRSIITAIVITAIVSSMFSGCTEKERARKFGGTSTVTLNAGQKLVVITWKEDNLWFLTRPMQNGESPETYKFTEDSSYGAMEGEITIIEQR